jgi:chromosome partitioning protein
MQKIMLLNPKGGCGKSTLSTNLAGYYANFGMKVGLADFDPQKTSLSWLRNRTFDLKPIKAINPTPDRLVVDDDLDQLIIDTPAAIDRNLMISIIKNCDTIIIPVLPSPIDVQAASFFIYQLLLKYRITNEDKNICLVANRAKLKSIAYHDLVKFIATINIPLLTTLRDSSNYLKCAAKGASIFDYQTQTSRNNIEDWFPLINWLNTNES